MGGGGVVCQFKKKPLISFNLWRVTSSTRLIWIFKHGMNMLVLMFGESIYKGFFGNETVMKRFYFKT